MILTCLNMPMVCASMESIETSVKSVLSTVPMMKMV